MEGETYNLYLEDKVPLRIGKKKGPNGPLVFSPKIKFL